MATFGREKNEEGEEGEVTGPSPDLDWSHVLLGIGITTASHPMTYVKVLIQVGHEPIPPRATNNLFGRPILILPGLLQYMGHIRKMDGFLGLYRGLLPRICTGIIGTSVNSRIMEHMKASHPVDPIKDTDDLRTVAEKFVKTTSQETAARCLAVVVSQPFHVVTIRCMVQFIGRETAYSGPFSAVSEIWNNEGISGFFSGLVPRLLGEVFTLWLCNILAHLINTYLLPNDESLTNVSEFKSYSQAITGFLANMVTYPFTLVANCMAVTGSGLAAGQHPNMPLYTDWNDCWKHLDRMGQLKRGSSLFWRQYPKRHYVLNKGGF
ncbi:MTCH2 [Branchiostoma lanceolatum]|uniref:MTCH2 protein n=1 Tax=Branchiostoma lanceolatum TaxID=7740 RepID=A0A8K0EH70_BRALA|nr:MTCH2 [Branchiostoma lanceolatum]